MKVSEGGKEEEERKRQTKSNLFQCLTASPGRLE